MASTGTIGRPVARASFVERVEVERVAGGDDQRFLLAPHGKQPVAMNELGRKVRPGVEVDLGGRQIDEGRYPGRRPRRPGPALR